MTALLEVTDVSKYYGSTAVVDHVSLSIEAGEAVGLIGSNGAGKTTLFRMIAGETQVTSGSISFLGRRLPQRADARARLGIARTFQLVELFGGLSVLDHLLVALQAHEHSQGPLRDTMWRGESTDAELAQCLATLRLCGLDGNADVPATALSLGERRSVELARALVTNPRLLLADEPSSGLDADEAIGLAEVISRVRKESGLAVLLVEHDLTMVKAVSERVIAMDAGAVIAGGTFDVVMRNTAVLDSWLGRPA